MVPECTTLVCMLCLFLIFLFVATENSLKNILSTMLSNATDLSVSSQRLMNNMTTANVWDNFIF